MSSYSCKGIVIKHTKLNDSDRIVKVFTNNKGLVDIIVKSARKISSKKGGSVDLFNYVSIQVAEGKSLDLLTEVEVIDDYLNIKSDLFKISLVYYLAELLLSAEYEVFEGDQIMSHLLITLNRINQSKNQIISVLSLKNFELNFLKTIGYKMEFIALSEVKDLFEVISSNNLEKLANIKYNTESVKKLSDLIQEYTETVLERKFKKVNLLV